LRGPGDAKAQERIAAKVSALTGLSPERVRRTQGRIDARDWVADSDPSGRTITSLYDGATRGDNPSPGRRTREWSDPILDAMRAPLGEAMTTLTTGRLKWPVETARYEILNNHVSEGWNWGSGRHDLETLSDLRQARALDPHMKVLVAQGLYDLVTPYYAGKLLLDLTQAPSGGEPVGFMALPGGHMFYAVDSSRAALRDAARRMIVGD
jgi:carboxypeptidase C (cathepsin A)